MIQRPTNVKGSPDLIDSGIITTAIMLSFLCYYMIASPVIRKRRGEELKAVMEDSGEETELGPTGEGSIHVIADSYGRTELWTDFRISFLTGLNLSELATLTYELTQIRDLVRAESSTTTSQHRLHSRWEKTTMISCHGC